MEFFNEHVRIIKYEKDVREYLDGSYLLSPKRDSDIPVNIKDVGDNGYKRVLKHITFYAVIPWENREIDLETQTLITNKIVGFDMNCDRDNIYVVYNGFWAYNHPFEHEMYKEYGVTCEEFCKHSDIARNMVRYMAIMTTSIAGALSFSRYVEETTGINTVMWSILSTKDIVHPDHTDVKEELRGMEEEFYRLVVEQMYNNSTYVSRNFRTKNFEHLDLLPLTSTVECMYTFSLSEWRDIIDMMSNKRFKMEIRNTTQLRNMLNDALNEASSIENEMV